jgi:general stress protein YciG
MSTQRGFGRNPELAKEAGRKGGEVVKARYGVQHLRDIGERGGNLLYMDRGPSYFSEIGKKGGDARAVAMRARLAKEQEATP